MPLLAIPFPPIDPVLIAVGPFAVRWYALAYIAGLLIGWWYVARLVATPRLWAPGAAPMAKADADDLLVAVTLGVVLGGRLGYVLFYNWPVYAGNPLAALRIWEGGMSFHGGLVGTGLALLVFSRLRKVPFLTLTDLVTAAVPVGIFFGRIANFINAELWGRPTDLPWGVIFPGAGPEPRHPSQLYEAVLEGLLLFVVLRVLTHRRGALARPGTVTAVFLVGYGVARFLVEFVRTPDAQIGFLAGGLTMGQVLSLPTVAVGLAVLVLVRRRPA